MSMRLAVTYYGQTAFHREATSQKLYLKIATVLILVGVMLIIFNQQAAFSGNPQWLPTFLFAAGGAVACVGALFMCVSAHVIFDNRGEIADHYYREVGQHEKVATALNETKPVIALHEKFARLGLPIIEDYLKRIIEQGSWSISLIVAVPPSALGPRNTGMSTTVWMLARELGLPIVISTFTLSHRPLGAHTDISRQSTDLIPFLNGLLGQQLLRLPLTYIGPTTTCTPDGNPYHSYSYSSDDNKDQAPWIS